MSTVRSILGKEWWLTVRYAIKDQHRTFRLIGILVTVGVAGALIIIASGVTVTIG